MLTINGVQARVLVVNSLLTFDVVVGHGDTAEEVKDKIREALGWEATYDFTIHCAPENDTQWLSAVRAFQVELLEGQNEAVQRLACTRTSVRARTPMYLRMNRHAGTLVQLLVVAPSHPRPTRVPGYDGRPASPIDRTNRTDIQDVDVDSVVAKAADDEAAHHGH